MAVFPPGDRGPESPICLLVRRRDVVAKASGQADDSINKEETVAENGGPDGAGTSDSQSAAARGARQFAGMTVANDSPLERLHVPRRGSDLRAKPERYQMVVSEHQRRLQHMLNWQFEPPRRRRLRSKSLTCNVALRTGPRKEPLLPSCSS